MVLTNKKPVGQRVDAGIEWLDMYAPSNWRQTVIEHIDQLDMGSSEGCVCGMAMDEMAYGARVLGHSDMMSGAHLAFAIIERDIRAGFPGSEWKRGVAIRRNVELGFNVYSAMGAGNWVQGDQAELDELRDAWKEALLNGA